MRTTKSMAMKMAEAEEHSKRFQNLTCYCTKAPKTGACYMHTVDWMVREEIREGFILYAVYQNGKRIK